MAKRETYTAAVTCDCGSGGQGQFSEVENLVYNNRQLETKILMVPEGFSIRSNKIHCNNCGAIQ